MAMAAALSLSLYLSVALSVAPQEPPPAAETEAKKAATVEDPRLKRGLTPQEIKTLNGLAHKWFRAREKWREDTNPRNGQLRRQTRAKFIEQWRKHNESPFRYMADVLDIFAGTLGYKAQSIGQDLRTFKEKDKADNWSTTFDLAGPRSYNPKNEYGCVVLLAGKDKPRTYFEQTWKKAPLTEDYFVLVPAMAATDDYDPIPTMSKAAEEEGEQKRIESVLLPAGEMQRKFNIDRRRYVLDCGVGNCLFGLRLASYFPARFAGIILRHPAGAQKLLASMRLDSLSGVPVLLVSTTATAADCKALADTLNGLQAGSCTVLKAKTKAKENGKDEEKEEDAYPFAASQAEIDAWTRRVRRPLFPAKVVIAPNHERFGQSHWVAILKLEPLEMFAVAERPMLVVEAKRDKNTIEVTARHVGEFVLSLNDSLVDLEKEVTVVINGKSSKKKFVRRLEDMVEEMVDKTFDPTHVYCAFQRFVVPREEKKPEVKKAEAAADGKASDGKPGDGKPGDSKPGDGKPGGGAGGGSPK